MSWKFWSREARAEGSDDAGDVFRSEAAAPAASSAAPVPLRPVFLETLWQSEDSTPRLNTMPKFAATASDDVEAGDGDTTQARRRLALRDALGASQPVIDRESFAGRHDALAQLINSIEQQRVHVVIYGERGIGKTSLAHVFAETAREARYLVLYGSCGTEAVFDTMFRGFAAKIPSIYHKSILPTSPEAERGGNLDTMLPDEFGPRELAEVFADVVGTRVIIILDEYDRVLDPTFRRDVAELIKNLSDRAARVQLVLTGVAQNLDELIGYAPSIRRNIIGLPMRPLSTQEVKQVLTIGENAAQITYSDEAAQMIATMAGGSPYLVRLLAHRAGMAALDERRNFVDEKHGLAAVERVLTDWNASLPRRVQAILAREEARAQWPLLVAAARAGSTADGYFTVDDVLIEQGGTGSAATIERDLRLFVHSYDLLEASEAPGEMRFRFRYPGVSSLLLMSAAMARLSV